MYERVYVCPTYLCGKQCFERFRANIVSSAHAHVDPGVWKL